MVKIYIDAGHGGTDGGATSGGVLEKDLTLQISKEIQSLLKLYKDVKIKMSRTGNQTRSLAYRTNEANKWGADLFVSVHINAGGGTGFESYIHNSLKDKSTTNKRRNIIHDEIMKKIKVKDRGKKKANFHVLRQSKMSSLLTENLFIDTTADRNKLKKKTFIKDLAQGHVNGIVKVFNLKKKKADPKPKPNNKTFYRVVAGSFNDHDNAKNKAKQLKSKGEDVFIDVYKK